MKKLRKLTLAALLTAAGLVVFVIEAQLPPLAAIPGIKPGLSNVFTMLTLFWVGPSWALGTMFVRVSLGCLLTAVLPDSLLQRARAFLPQPTQQIRIFYGASLPCHFFQHAVTLQVAQCGAFVAATRRSL